MALYLVLLSTILAFSLTSTEQYVSSPGSSIDLSLDSIKNGSGHWITRVDTGRYKKKENTQPLSVNVLQGMSNKTEQLAHPPLHDTSMIAAVQPTADSTNTSTTTTTTTTTTNTTNTTNTTTTSTTTTTTTNTYTITTNNTSSITTNTTTSTYCTTTTTTNTTTPKSCPQSGYQLYPGFNCYKAFPSRGESKTWSEAREQCMTDGADLMVMDSARELEDVYLPLYNSVTWDGIDDAPWVGVYIPQDGNNWRTVKGQPALSSWWRPGYPVNVARYTCAQALSTGLLVNYNNCADARSFICEISL